MRRPVANPELSDVPLGARRGPLALDATSGRAPDAPAPGLDLPAIYELTSLVARTRDSALVLERVAELAIEYGGVAGVAILLRAPEETDLIVTLARGDGLAPLVGRRLPPEGGIAGWVARQREPLLVGTPDAPFSAGLDDPLADPRLVLALPLLAGGTFVGVLTGYADPSSPLGAAPDVKTLSVLANVAAVAVDAARLDANAHEAEERKQAEKEREKSERALRETNRRLQSALSKVKQMQHQIIQQERLRALGQMASGVAHDFNNDLAMIVGFSELLLKRPEDLKNTEKARSYLQMIRTIAGDASNVVDRLREFFRQRDEGEAFLAVNVNQLIEQAILLTQPRWKYQAQANSAHIRVETNFGELPDISGNAGDLREALTNLILNAVDAMPNGGTLTITTRLDGEQVCLEVSDTGLGMTEEVRKRCLEPFFTTKGERGTGLGLSMVYGTVERHEGTIDIQSTVGEGTTFVIRLPIEHREELGKGQSSSAAVFTGPWRVLVVEDEAPIRRILTEYLAFDGHDVETAVNGRDGLEKFVARAAEDAPGGKFDLVLTDLAMPELSGDQLALAIKRVAPRTPIILLTGFGEMMRASGELPVGVDLILPKPVSLAALQQAVAKAIGK